MKDYSKLFIEAIVSKAKGADKTRREANGSFEMKISDADIKNILNRQRLRKGLKDNIMKDLKTSTLKASSCDTNSICVIIPKDKLEKNINKFSDI